MNTAISVINSVIPLSSCNSSSKRLRYFGYDLIVSDANIPHTKDLGSRMNYNNGVLEKSIRVTYFKSSMGRVQQALCMGFKA